MEATRHLPPSFLPALSEQPSSLQCQENGSDLGAEGLHCALTASPTPLNVPHCAPTPSNVLPTDSLFSKGPAVGGKGPGGHPASTVTIHVLDPSLLDSTAEGDAGGAAQGSWQLVPLDNAATAAGTELAPAPTHTPAHAASPVPPHPTLPHIPTLALPLTRPTTASSSISTSKGGSQQGGRLTSGLRAGGRHRSAVARAGTVMELLKQLDQHVSAVDTY